MDRVTREARKAEDGLQEGSENRAGLCAEGLWEKLMQGWKVLFRRLARFFWPFDHWSGGTAGRRCVTKATASNLDVLPYRADSKTLPTV